MRRTHLSLLCLLVMSLAAFAEPRVQPVPPPGEAGANVYRQVLPSTVWIHSDRGRGKVATGSGSLVDRGRRLVLTNYHVVGDVKTATVFFPDFSKSNRAIPERQHYLNRAGKLGIPGEVVEVDMEGDLALVRIDRVPDSATGLALAESSPDPGQAVHSIGNPGKSDALWVYTPGKVRQVYAKRWRAKLDERTIIEFKARVIESDSPTNPGDSGGPLVNDRGELVGVTQGGAIDAQALSIFVDLSEVRRLLNRRSVQVLRSVDAQPTEDGKGLPKTPRDAPLKSKDEGKFFSEAAWKKLQAAADRLLKEKGIDLLVETYTVAPKMNADKLKAMTPDEREKTFREFARERSKAEKLNGIYVVVNKNPGYAYIEVSGPAAETFPSGFGSRLSKTLIDAFKEKKFDDGLTQAVEMILEFQGLGEKKKGEDKK